MRNFVVLCAALLLSGTAFATNQQPPKGGDSSAESSALGVGVGIGVAGASSESNANAGALAGAAVLGSGNSEIKNSGNSAAGAAVLGSGNSNVDVVNRNTNANLNANVNDVDVTNRNNVRNDVTTVVAPFTSNAQQQGQLQGQLQGQVANGGNASIAEGAVNNTNRNVANGGVALAGAVSEGSSAYSEGSTSTSSATQQQSAVATNEGNTVTSQGNTTSTNVTVEGDEAADIPVSSAAPSFSSICSSGAAGQGGSWGISLAVTSDVCMNLQMADAYMALGDRETAIEYVKRAGAHAKTKGVMGYIRHVLTLGIL